MAAPKSLLGSSATTDPTGAPFLRDGALPYGKVALHYFGDVWQVCHTCPDPFIDARRDFFVRRDALRYYLGSVRDAICGYGYVTPK